MTYSARSIADGLEGKKRYAPYIETGGRKRWFPDVWDWRSFQGGSVCIPRELWGEF